MAKGKDRPFGVDSGASVRVSQGSVFGPGVELVERHRRRRKQPEGGLRPRSDGDRLRLELRDLGQQVTSGAGVRRCGRVPTRGFRGMEGSVTLKVRPASGRAYFTGLQRCSSVWECTLCAPRIQRFRAEQLVRLNDAHGATGGRMYLLTLTLPHDEGDALRPMRRHVSRAWSKVTSGAPWLRWKSRLGLAGSVRALEVTHGANGWHPHLHVALYVEGEIQPLTLTEFREWVYARWCLYVTRQTPEGRVYRTPSRRNGVRLDPLYQADYLAKMGWRLSARAKEGIADEIASSTTKQGRAGHQTPFQILRAAHEERDPARRSQLLELWREWGNGIRGARQLTYSRDLVQRYGVAMLDDDEIPDEANDQLSLEALDGPGEILGVWNAIEWEQICRAGLWVRSMLLEVGAVHPELRRWRVAQIVDKALGRNQDVPF